MAVNTSSTSIEPTSQPDESPSGNFTLENILGTNHEDVEHPRLKEKDSGDATGPGEGWDEESAVRPAADGFCVECEGVWLTGDHADRVELTAYIDQPAQVVCDACADNYCEVCFAAQHRKGSREKHIAKPIPSDAKSKSVQNGVAEDAKKNGEKVRTFFGLAVVDQILTSLLSKKTLLIWMTLMKNLTVYRLKHQRLNPYRSRKLSMMIHSGCIID
jgi:hypothetical protein